MIPSGRPEIRIKVQDSEESSDSSDTGPSAGATLALGVDWASASLIRRDTSILFLTPPSITNEITGVKRVFKRAASFDWTKPAAWRKACMHRRCSWGEPIRETKTLPC